MNPHLYCGVSLAANGQSALTWKTAPPAVVLPTFRPLETTPLQSGETLRDLFAPPDVHAWEIAPAPASFFVENETLAPGWKA